MKNDKKSWFDMLGIVGVIPPDIEYPAVELKPCPFCESLCVSLKIVIGSGQSHVAEARVVCESCKSSGPVTFDWNNKEFKKQAIDAWNNRSKS